MLAAEDDGGAEMVRFGAAEECSGATSQRMSFAQSAGGAMLLCVGSESCLEWRLDRDEEMVICVCSLPVPALHE